MGKGRKRGSGTPGNSNTLPNKHGRNEDSLQGDTTAKAADGSANGAKRKSTPQVDKTHQKSADAATASARNTGTQSPREPPIIRRTSSKQTGREGGIENPKQTSGGRPNESAGTNLDDTTAAKNPSNLTKQHTEDDMEEEQTEEGSNLGTPYRKEDASMEDAGETGTSPAMSTRTPDGPPQTSGPEDNSTPATPPNDQEEWRKYLTKDDEESTVPQRNGRGLMPKRVDVVRCRFRIRMDELVDVLPNNTFLPPEKYKMLQPVISWIFKQLRIADPTVAWHPWKDTESRPTAALDIKNIPKAYRDFVGRYILNRYSFSTEATGTYVYFNARLGFTKTRAKILPKLSEILEGTATVDVMELQDENPTPIGVLWGGSRHTDHKTLSKVLSGKAEIPINIRYRKMRGEQTKALFVEVAERDADVATELLLGWYPLNVEDQDHSTYPLYHTYAFLVDVSRKETARWARGQRDIEERPFIEVTEFVEIDSVISKPGFKPLSIRDLLMNIVTRDGKRLLFAEANEAFTGGKHILTVREGHLDHAEQLSQSLSEYLRFHWRNEIDMRKFVRCVTREARDRALTTKIDQETGIPHHKYAFRPSKFSQESAECLGISKEAHKELTAGDEESESDCSTLSAGSIAIWREHVQAAKATGSLNGQEDRALPPSMAMMGGVPPTPMITVERNRKGSSRTHQQATRNEESTTAAARARTDTSVSAQSMDATIKSAVSSAVSEALESVAKLLADNNTAQQNTMMINNKAQSEHFILMMEAQTARFAQMMISNTDKHKDDRSTTRSTPLSTSEGTAAKPGGLTTTTAGTLDLQAGHPGNKEEDDTPADEGPLVRAN
jgi:hypothetical protein